MFYARVRALVVAGLLISTELAPAQSAADTLRKWGLLGTWALDCSQPPSRQNSHLTYRATRDGRASHDRAFGDTQDANEVLASTIAADGSLTLRVRFPSLSQTREFSFIKGADGRIRAMSNRAGGDYSVKNGKFISNGLPTPWQTRCR
jgi:hypothetical protein